MKYWVIITLFLSLSSFAKERKDQKNIDFTPKQKKLLKIINKEFKLVSDLLKSRKTNPTMYFRKYNLYTEKLKIYHDLENRRFLKTSFKKQKKLGKKHFFKVSRNLYLKSLNLGKFIVKKFKGSYILPEVYYHMGLNSRDYGKDGLAKKYLEQAIKLSPLNSKVSFEAKGTLADYFYNEKIYKKAIPLYEDVLKRSKNDWYTKYSYNLAWCLLKSKKYSEAIQRMKEAFFYSKKDGFIDVSDQVLDNIGLFYAHSNRVHDGINFYIKNTKKHNYYLIKMAELLMNRGLFEFGELTLTSALNHAKDKSSKIKVYATMLELYKVFQKDSKHYKTTKRLFSMHRDDPLSEEDSKMFTEKLVTFVEFIRLKVSQKFYHKRPEQLNRKMNMTIKYYEILSKIDAKKAASYYALIGEVYYEIGKKEKAIEVYYRAWRTVLKNKGELKLKKSIINAMIATLGEINTNSSTYKKYLVYSFEEYIREFPKSNQSRAINKKLFNIYFKKKDLKKAQLAIDRYHVNYPKDIQFQRGMATEILKYHMKSRNTYKISSWITKLKTGYLQFDEKFIEKTELNLGAILFEDTKAFVDAGKTNKAIKRYEELYKDKKYPDKIKAKSAYNLALIYLDQANTQLANEWLLKAWALFEKKELDRMNGNIKSFATTFYQMQDFEGAQLISEKGLKYFCNTKTKDRNEFYYMASYFAFLNEDFSQGWRVYSQYNSKCKINNETYRKSTLAMLNALTFAKNHKTFFKYLNHFKKLTFLKKDMFPILFQIYKYNEEAQNNSLAQKAKAEVVKYLNEAGPKIIKPEYKEYIHSMFTLHKFGAKVKKYLKEEFKNDLEKPFNDAAYNKWLESRIAELVKLTDEGVAIVNKGYPEPGITVLKNLYHLYQDMAKQVLSVHPQKKNPVFVKGFKQAMGQVANGFRLKSQEFYKTANLKVKQQKVFYRDNTWVKTLNSFPVPFQYSYIYDGIIVDSQGGIK